MEGKGNIEESDEAGVMPVFLCLRDNRERFYSFFLPALDENMFYRYNDRKK